MHFQKATWALGLSPLCIGKRLHVGRKTQKINVYESNFTVLKKKNTFSEIIFIILARTSDEHFFSCPCFHRSLLVEVGYMWRKLNLYKADTDTCTGGLHVSKVK